MSTWREDITCWKPQQADQLIPVEAEALSDELFQATHVPLRLRRVSATNPMSVKGDDVSEVDVLQAIQGRLRGSGRQTDIFPILGASGAGKSHLVRWLRNELLGQAGFDDVRFVFVPKHRTSLRGVIAAIFSAFEDVPEIAELRDRLLAARDDSITESEFRTRVRDALCNGLQYHSERTEASDPTQEETRKYIAASLPSILRDPHFAPRYLDDGGAIARLVEEKLTGRRGDDALENAFRFVAQDVAVTVDDLSHAAKAAQEMAQALASNPLIHDETLQSFSARMLNDQLPGAIKEVFGVGGEDLRDLFVEVRQVLHGKQDIVLLVEDFAMFQGLQAGLLDAMGLASTVSQKLCHLITVVAVTTGYYNDEIPDTFKTRSSTAFVVDEQGDAAASSFAAQYLRAMRLMSDGRGVEDGGSSCQSCPVMTACHDGFGHVEGEGLFPFNRVMLDRGVTTRLGGVFNARRFLTQVLRPVLVQGHDAIQAEEHPNEELAEYFDARHFEPAGDALMHLRQTEQGERRARLALLYRDPVNDGDLNQPIHHAFGLSPLGRVATVVACSEGGCALPVVRGGFCADHAPKVTDEGSKTPALVVAVDQWRRGEAIAQAHRTAIRQLVTKAIMSRVDFSDGAYRSSAWGASAKPHPRIDTSKNAKSIVIDGNRQLSGGWIEVELSHQDADVVSAVQALAWLDAKGSWRDVPRGLERMGLLEKMLGQWTRHVETVLGLRSSVDDELVAAVAALEALAGLAGHGPVPKRRSDRLARLRSLDEAKGSRWGLAQDALERMKAERAVLLELVERRLAYAQGVGAPVAYDAVLVKKVFDAVKDVSLLQGEEKSPVGKALRSVAKRLEAAESWEAQLVEQLPDASQLGDEVPADIMTDLDVVVRGAQVSSELRRSAKEAAKRVTAGDVRAVEQARKAIGDWDKLNAADRAALAGGSWFEAAGRVRDFLAQATAVLAAATPRDMSLDSSQRSLVEAEWGQALDAAELAVKELRKAAR